MYTYDAVGSHERVGFSCQVRLAPPFQAPQPFIKPEECDAEARVQSGVACAVLPRDTALPVLDAGSGCLF